MPIERPLRWGPLLVVATILLYLAVGGYLSRALVTWDDETAYVALGRLAVTGEISLYQDDLTGQRMPLPFYVIGASQVMFGRNLWAARLVSLLLGVCVVGITITIGQSLDGELSGVLAGLLLVTQGVIVGYYATATYHALTASILMASVWVLLKKNIPWRCALGMGIASLLFVTRTNMFPMVPFFFVWAFVGARNVVERLAVILITGAPPTIFFLADPTHLKLLAHVPVLHHLVESLGYRSILSFSAIHYATLPEQFWALALLARRFESWTVAAAGLAAAAVLLPRKRDRRPRLTEKGRDLAVIGALFVWCLVWHFIIWRINFKYALAFFPIFAPLAAVLLGVGFAVLLRSSELPSAGRGILQITLAVSLTLSLVFIRHPLLPDPTPRPFYGDPVQRLDRSAAELRILVHTEEKIFLFAQPMLAYLAGLNPPLQQVMSAGGTLAPSTSDPQLIARSGAWGLVEIDRWLGDEVQYAVISNRLLETFAAIRPEAISRIRELLRDRFKLTGSVGDTGSTGNTPYAAVDIYRRFNGQ